MTDTFFYNDQVFEKTNACEKKLLRTDLTCDVTDVATKCRIYNMHFFNMPPFLNNLPSNNLLKIIILFLNPLQFFAILWLQ